MYNHHLQSRVGHNLRSSSATAAPSPPVVTKLQNQWYNTLAQAVAGNANFQILQPNAPIPPQATNDQLWQFFNDLPPVSLNNNLTLSGGNQLYSNYTAVLSQLVSNALTNFQAVLGSSYPLWQQIAVGTTLHLSARVAPRTDPDGRHYRIRFLSWMVA
jgi:hypothetical protein